jgi:hypothetical protein
MPRDKNPGDPENFVQYWVYGEGADRIRWGEPHDFARCVMYLERHYPKDPEGLCSNLHLRALGVRPGQEGG